MKAKRAISTIVVMLVVLSAPFSAMAAAESPPSLNGNEALQMTARWVAQINWRNQLTVGINEQLPGSLYVQAQVGWDSATGAPVNGSGYLNLTGTLYYFPSADQKTGIYEGFLTAYVNGDLLPNT